MFSFVEGILPFCILFILTKRVYGVVGSGLCRNATSKFKIHWNQVVVAKTVAKVNQGEETEIVGENINFIVSTQRSDHKKENTLTLIMICTVVAFFVAHFPR